MNEVITIENTKMQIREYAGQRVVTFKDIDTVHGNKSGTAKSNFARHKKHFVEGEDYILLTRGDSKGDKLSLLNIDIPTRGITVLTENGYLLIAKSFNDDLSWTVQRQLVNAYFKGKDLFEEVQLGTPLVYETSKTLLPRQGNWYAINESTIRYIAAMEKTTSKKVISYILRRVNAEYSVDRAKAVYIVEKGEEPKYPLDLVSYFPELREPADKALELLYNYVIEKNKKGVC